MSLAPAMLTPLHSVMIRMAKLERAGESVVPTFCQFTNQDIPEAYAHQIRDFIRIHWFDVFHYDVHAPAMPAAWHPVYFVVVDGPALFSHAAVVTQAVECKGQTYSCGGLGSVLPTQHFGNAGMVTRSYKRQRST